MYVIGLMCAITYFFTVFSFGVGVTVFAMGFMYIDGTVFQIAYTFFGVAGGPLVGVFALGMFLPWSTAKVESYIPLTKL